MSPAEVARGLEAGDTVRYCHAPGTKDEVRVGTFVRRNGGDFPNVVVLRNGMGREIAVHTQNLIAKES